MRLDSASLNVPSESAISTILRSSALETETSAVGCPFASALVIASVSQLSTIVTGLNTTTKKRMTGEILIEIRLGNAAATDFGITSEKIMMITVKMADASPTLKPYCIA